MFKIVKKELTLFFRDWTNTLYCLIFPLLLILLLANAFGPIMIGDITIGKGDYALILETKDDYNKKHIEKYFDEVNKNIDFLTIQIIEHENFNPKNFDGYIKINDENITFYDFRPEKTTGKILNQMLKVYTNKTNLVIEAIKENKFNLTENIINMENSVKYISLDGKILKKESAYSIFSITISTLILTWLSYYALSNVQSDLTQGTLMRTKFSPISTENIFVQKTTTFLIISIIQILLLMIFNKVLYKVEFVNEIYVFVSFFSLAFLYISFGMMMASTNLKPALQMAITQTLMQMSIFFGGSYMPIGENMGFLSIAKKISPVGYVNIALENLMLLGDNSSIHIIIVKNIIAGIIFIFLGFILFKRKKVIK